MEERAARGYTVAELHQIGPEGLPEEYVSSRHLVYNSPASLAFNSPGAEGFGVKRAGLAIPESVMLIVSPGCCGRNTSEITRIRGYEDRFFYLEIKEADLVTGCHLKAIPQAVMELVSVCKKRPSLVMICITCVDALLGTDMERVARKAEDLVGLPVRPCYMYALTREGRRPPMVAVRQSLYSLLPKQRRRATSINLLGFFAPVDPESELFLLLKRLGVQTIRQISTCPDMDAFRRMGEANFNLVLNPEARDAAEDLRKRLGIPSIELTRFYGPDRIEGQYRALWRALDRDWEKDQAQREGSGQGKTAGQAKPETGPETGADERSKKAGDEEQEGTGRSRDWGRASALQALARLRTGYPDLVFSVGETINANPFELALTLAEEGFAVREIFANPAPEYAYYIRRLALLTPKTMVYSNMEPTMLYYGCSQEAWRKGDGREPLEEGQSKRTDRAKALTGRLGKEAGKVLPPTEIPVTLGKDAAFYHPDAVHVHWNSDQQPWGYAGLRKLAEAIRQEVSASCRKEAPLQALASRGMMGEETER